MSEPTEVIAGHTFTLKRDAICTIGTCGMAWPRLKEFVHAEQLNQLGYAHTGALNYTEINEINFRRQREQAEEDRMFSLVAELSKQ